MISASPHLYREIAAKRGIPPEVVGRAIEQAKLPQRNGLPAILTLGHLAQLTGAEYSYLRSIVSRTREGYRLFTIKKRYGGARLIAAPEPILAAVQKWIVNRILINRPVHFASCAYSRGANPIKCAERHLKARWLIKVDIHDFFESISERRVYFVFRECGYQPLVAFELARICTRVSTGKSRSEDVWQSNRRRSSPGLAAYESQVMGHLPQGAPTSPMLSNLVSRALDESLQALADRKMLVYTRYSDDVIFSTGAGFSRREAQELIRDVQRLFSAFGFALHRQKITIAPPGARKIALGLLVDGDKLRLSRDFRNRISDHVRGIEKFGLTNHAREFHFASLWGLVRHVAGLLEYARSVDAPFAAPLIERFAVALNVQGWPSKRTA